MKKTSKSKLIAQKAVFAALTILKEAGGEMRGKEVIDRIRETIDFDDYAKHVYEKSRIRAVVKYPPFLYYRLHESWFSKKANRHLVSYPRRGRSFKVWPGEIAGNGNKEVSGMGCYAE